MRRPNDNICKFVTGAGNENFAVINFVFEKNGENPGHTQIKKSDTMYLVADGRGRLCTERVTKELEPGTLFFTFAGEPYRIENTEEMHYMYITFRGKRSGELFERFGISPSICVFGGYEGLLSFWQSALGKANGKNLDLVSESVLLYTFSQMSQLTEDSEQYLTGNILSYIETHFTEPELSLASCAAGLGYNAKYLSRIFRQNVGSTFSEHLKSTRIRHAVFLMEQGVNVVKNVALLSGYSDPLYFSKVFRQTVGISPTEFIERNASAGQNKIEKEQENGAV